MLYIFFITIKNAEFLNSLEEQENLAILGLLSCMSLGSKDAPSGRALASVPTHPYCPPVVEAECQFVT